MDCKYDIGQEKKYYYGNVVKCWCMAIEKNKTYPVTKNTFKKLCPLKKEIKK